MNSTCFISSDPAAVNASIVFDFISDVNLWEKPDLQTPLPLCSAAPPPAAADSTCLVCRDQEVFAVCRGLPDPVNVMMEAMGKTMKIRESDCPLLPSDDDYSWPLSVIIAAVLLIFLIILITLLYCRCRKKRVPQHRREGNVTGGENGSTLLPGEEESPV